MASPTSRDETLSLKGVERTANAQGDEDVSMGSAAWAQEGPRPQSVRLADGPAIPISQTGNRGSLRSPGSQGDLGDSCDRVTPVRVRPRPWASCLGSHFPAVHVTGPPGLLAGRREMCVSSLCFCLMSVIN